MGDSLNRISTGIEGLDHVLDGGLLANRSYLIRGAPGTGKTTLGMHFLVEGAKNDETPLYVNMGEDIETFHQTADGFGLDLENVRFLDLSPTTEAFVEDQTYDIFPSSEVERGPLTEK